MSGATGLLEATAADAFAMHAPVDATPAFFTHEAGPAQRWFVLHTHSRQEKALAETLDARGVRCFLPLVRAVRYYGHRRRVTERPLFPAYLFLWGTIDCTYFAVATKRVARVLPVPDQPRLTLELTHIRRALDGEAELDPFPFLAVGRRVRVTAGPLRGVEGVVQARPTEIRLVLCVQTLGQAVSTEIDASLLEPVD
ncbi:MAG: transcription termination/antitermination protein NusG [Phycisphaerales bacterium]